MTESELYQRIREMESERFDCHYCKQNLCVTYDYIYGDGDEATCYGCIAALEYLWTGDAEMLRIVRDPNLHIAVMVRELPDGFRCGFCGYWREHWQHGFNDCGVPHCATCADALDALSDGVTDALAIWRGAES